MEAWDSKTRGVEKYGFETKKNLRFNADECWFCTHHLKPFLEAIDSSGLVHTNQKKISI